MESNNHPDRLSIVVIGASGDLSRRKIFPALFALYCQNYLPTDFHVFGFARSDLGEEEFQSRIVEHITCRYVPGESCQQRIDEFLKRCHYVQGDYDSRDSFLDLYQAMRVLERRQPTDRLFYLAIPPSIFVDVANSIGNAGLTVCGDGRPWSRIVIEKPFGRDRASSDELAEALAQMSSEEQTYRIDHYLGKEVIQNLLVLRFANTVFEPLWNRDFIESVEVLWQENLGLEGRGGYFDQYGIIRDVIQNHLLQIVALVAMEPPAKLDAAHINAEKVDLLRRIPPVTREEIVVGQYGQGRLGDRVYPAYVEDPQVPDDSLTPTFAACTLRIGGPRWDGVPFRIRAGKGLDARMTEISIRFRPVAGNMFCQPAACPNANELVIRVQPDEAIYLSITNKVPGAGLKLQASRLNLQYRDAFAETIPDAYENLLLDVIEGDRSLFIPRSELDAAWDIFTPVLNALEEERIVPELYAYGGSGPDLEGRWSR